MERRASRPSSKLRPGASFCVSQPTSSAALPSADKETITVQVTMLGICCVHRLLEKGVKHENDE